MKEMTGRERIAALIRGEKTDRVPVMAFIGGYAARLAGISLKDYFTDIDQCVRVQLLAAELHGYDDAPNYGWADWGGWEFGGKIRFPENYIESAPRVEANVISSPEEAESLKVPDVRTAGVYPLQHRYNEAMRRLGLPAKICGGSVTNVVSGIAGKEKLLRWYNKEPQAVHILYRKAVELILKTAEATIADFGPENCAAGFAFPLDSNDLINRSLFERFVFPYQSEVNAGLMERGIRRFSVHICGNHRRNLEVWADIPLPPRSTISIGSQMDLVEVAGAFKNRHIVAGNLSTQLLNSGSYDEVYQAACRCIEIGRNLPGGYILMPACELPVTTPPLNVMAMVRAALDSRS